MLALNSVICQSIPAWHQKHIPRSPGPFRVVVEAALNQKGFLILLYFVYYSKGRVVIFFHVNIAACQFSGSLSVVRVFRGVLGSLIQAHSACKWGNAGFSFLLATFLCFSCFIVLAKTKPNWMRVESVDILVLFLILLEMLWFFSPYLWMYSKETADITVP